MSENGTSGNVYTGKVRRKRVGSFDDGIVYNLAGANMGTYGNGHIALYGGGGLLGSYKDGTIYGQYGGIVGYYGDGKLYNENKEWSGSYSGDDAGGASGYFMLVVCA